MHISNFYDCEPVGFEGDNFLNLVVGFECDLSVAELAKALHQIESENGRQRETKAYASRTMDIDILLYGDQVGIIDGVVAAKRRNNRVRFCAQAVSRCCRARTSSHSRHLFSASLG